MRLEEQALSDEQVAPSIRYYHARGEELDDIPDGEGLMRPWRRVMKSDPEEKIDDLFEAQRAGRSFARNTAFFMIGLSSGAEVMRSHFTNIGVQSSEYVYEFTPATEPSKHDWYWARELHARHPPLIGGRKIQFRTFQPDPLYVSLTDEEIAERYWSGTASREPRWEYLTDRILAADCVISPNSG